MKKTIYLFLFIALLICGSIQVNASSGQLRKASIKTCNGTLYGQHSSDNHWHVAEEKDGKYYATGDPIYSDPCSSNNNNNNNNNDSGNDKTEDSNSNTNTNNNTTNNGSTDNNTSNNGGSTSNDTTTNKPSGGSTSNGTTTNKPSNSGSTSTDDKNTQKEEPKSSDNTLKVILIDGKELQVTDNIKYSTTKEKVKIEAEPNDEKATIEIKDNNELSIGENKVSIEVKAEDGKTKTYIINITRELVLSSNTGIEVIIDGEKVSFSNNKATVYVSSSATSVTIDYTLADEKAKAEMDKLDKLKTGDNELKIDVTAEDGTKVTYQITIHKYTKAEDIISTVLAFAMLGGFGYGIYFVIKKGKNFFKKIKK